MKHLYQVMPTQWKTVEGKSEQEISLDLYLDLSQIYTGSNIILFHLQEDCSFAIFKIL